MTHEEWKSEGARLFGPDVRGWAFACPLCGHRQTVAQCFDAGMPAEEIGRVCVGRYSDARPYGPASGPCLYHGGGLFNLNPVEVAMPPDWILDPSPRPVRVFAFARPL